MKVYGNSKYKAYVMTKHKTTGEKCKCYINSVDPVFTGKDSHKSVSIGIYDGTFSGSDIKYKLGSNKKVDIAIKTWISERDKQKMNYSSNLPDSCYDYLKD